MKLLLVDLSWSNSAGLVGQLGVVSVSHSSSRVHVLLGHDISSQGGLGQDLLGQDRLLGDDGLDVGGLASEVLLDQDGLLCVTGKGGLSGGEGSLGKRLGETRGVTGTAQRTTGSSHSSKEVVEEVFRLLEGKELVDEVVFGENLEAVGLAGGVGGVEGLEGVLLLCGLDTGRGYDLDDVGEGDQGGDDTSSLSVRDPSKVGGADVDPSLQSAVHSISGLSGVLGDEGLVGELERGPTGIRVTSESRRAARDSSLQSRSLRLLEIDDLGTSSGSDVLSCALEMLEITGLDGGPVLRSGLVVAGELHVWF